MNSEHSKRHSGTITWVAALGLAALVALALGPALAGTASAAPIQAASGAPQSWAYGGMGNSSGTSTFDQTTITWNATFGWTVIYTATNTSPTTLMLEEQRTVGISIETTLTSPNVTGSYSYHAMENDTAFVNLTNASTVYVNGQPVPALGIDNESLAVNAAVSQAVHVTAFGKDHSAFLNISGVAQGSVQFSPSLGLIPLNLTGVTEWNSSSIATPQASWNISYNWADYKWNGGTSSGSNTIVGNWTASGPVEVTGFLVDVHHIWNDHKPRIGILLVVQGPVDAYDGFILVPHAFNLFGGSTHRFDSNALGSASVGCGTDQTLFVSGTPRGPMVTAAETDFGVSAVPAGFGASLGPSSGGVTPMAAAGPSPSAAVYGEPMSVAQAHALDHQLAGFGPASSVALRGLLGVAAVALLVVAVVGTVLVVAWRSYARRRSPEGTAGSYGRTWSNGPPAGALGPSAPVQNPSPPEGPRPPQP